MSVRDPTPNVLVVDDDRELADPRTDILAAQFGALADCYPGILVTRIGTISDPSMSII